jgi:hypothetical protein
MQAILGLSLRESVMRIRVLHLVALLPLFPPPSAFAQSPAPAITAAQIPASQLRFYCLKGGAPHTVGAIACFGHDRQGECKWAGANAVVAPPNRAYWQVTANSNCP